jgi:hypothetical protein
VQSGGSCTQKRDLQSVGASRVRAGDGRSTVRGRIFVITFGTSRVPILGFRTQGGRTLATVAALAVAAAGAVVSTGGAAAAVPGAVRGVRAQAVTAVSSPTVHRSDFLGNGYNDFAVGAPGGMVSGKAQAGYVVVTFGSRGGLQPARRVVLSQGRGGIPGAPTAGAQFGSALAVGDFNGEGYTDLAIGAPVTRGARGR